jgi:hypothetical protein
MSKPVICPGCSQADQVEKVSTIYMRGLELKWHSQRSRFQDKPETSPRLAGLLAELSPTELQALSRRLAPPSSGKRAPTRPLHPDLVVLVFSLVAPFFLYGIYTSQAGVLPLVLLILAAFYSFYFWKRKTIVAKYQAQQAAQRAAEERIQAGIGRWMRLHYCAREDCVFEPGGATPVPADQMAGYLSMDPVLTGSYTPPRHPKGEAE